MSDSPLLKTPLYDLHVELGAKMVPFAGYDMPVQYPLGVKKEHLHTREKAGLFDVSHMGQVKLVGANAAAALETLVPVDIIDLPAGKQRYALFTNEQGGLLDDLMVTNYGDHLYVVVNAACKEQDIAHMQAHLGEDVQLERLDDRALVALQGPAAVTALSRIAPEVANMVFMDSRLMTIDGVECFVSRSGYTGEDGYEISIPSSDAERLCRLFLEQPEVEAIGLGARDSLRLEAGLCLYGHDIDTTTTPIEGSLIWAISKPRRADGERAGGFPGAEIIFEQIANKSYKRKRVGLLAEGRAPIREGAELVNADGDKIGVVTSGSFGPSINAPVAMGYVETPYSVIDTQVFALVRGKQLPLTVSRTPFVEQRYYRG
ncbi:glycine cleavage system aminomethyltransferase GcvT [Aestuariirhabdus sp. Z084]|uniref:glycine cleavage system aminomethyltransferase GcvT n=1 Tax=Aestuariirhabdus haliotis TaxID=2918751 RepID=UPI00201B4122|nr:glycine cleavage system aminomethyltransferase GcvT [Aestuariirhabdus haliotis]MCL6416483.1 glycine cleavage system aminomethyltransferase GcvT [Aestuariirhabdus haliotis]MCL6420473.1 glycine cleavage system aminomethyltransferase GcvT [Aestuariirhabdus haliotis]